MIFKIPEPDFIKPMKPQNCELINKVQAASAPSSSKLLKKYNVNRSLASSTDASQRIQKIRLQENLFNHSQSSKKINEDVNNSDSKDSTCLSDDEDPRLSTDFSALHFKKPLGNGGIKTDDYDFYGSKRTTPIDWAQCLKEKQVVRDQKLDTSSNGSEVTPKVMESRLETIGQTVPLTNPMFCNYVKNSLKPDFVMRKEDNIVPKQGMSNLSSLKLENELKDSCKGIIETSGHELIDPTENELDMVHKMMRRKPSIIKKLVEICTNRIVRAPKVEVETYERVINKVVVMRDFGTQWCEEDFLKIESREIKNSILENRSENLIPDVTNLDHKPEIQKNEVSVASASVSESASQKIKTYRIKRSNFEDKIQVGVTSPSAKLTSKEVFEQELKNLEQDEESMEIEKLENEGKLFDENPMIPEKYDSDNKSDEFDLGVDSFDGFDVVNFEDTDIFKDIMSQVKMYQQISARDMEANGVRLEEIEDDEEDNQKINEIEEVQEKDEISEDTTSFASALDTSLKSRLYGSQNSISELSIDDM